MKCDRCEFEKPEKDILIFNKYSVSGIIHTCIDCIKKDGPIVKKAYIGCDCATCIAIRKNWK